MKYMITFFSFILFSLCIPNEILAQSLEDNRVLETEVFNGNNLYTGKFEGNSYCTAVVLSPKVALTAKHCIEDDYKNKTKGILYPASSGLSTQAGSLPITEYIPYNGEYDIALLIGTTPSPNMASYIKKGVNISSNRDIHTYKGKEVYTIGYPLDKGANFQYKTYGKVSDIQANKIIVTDLFTTGGQSGSGLFLKESNELIGILHGGGRFTAIDSTIRDWISTKSLSAQ